jgi:cobalamin biosynthesis Mg chelatase CobN
MSSSAKNVSASENAIIADNGAKVNEAGAIVAAGSIALPGGIAGDKNQTGGTAINGAARDIHIESSDPATVQAALAYTAKLSGDVLAAQSTSQAKTFEAIAGLTANFGKTQADTAQKEIAATTTAKEIDATGGVSIFKTPLVIAMIAAVVVAGIIFAKRK